jgi:hypothetical protein
MHAGALHGIHSTPFPSACRPKQGNEPCIVSPEMADEAWERKARYDSLKSYSLQLMRRSNAMDEKVKAQDEQAKGVQVELDACRQQTAWLESQRKAQEEKITYLVTEAHVFLQENARLEAELSGCRQQLADLQEAKEQQAPATPSTSLPPSPGPTTPSALTLALTPSLPAPSESRDWGNLVGFLSTVACHEQAAAHRGMAAIVPSSPPVSVAVASATCQPWSRREACTMVQAIRSKIDFWKFDSPRSEQKWLKKVAASALST